jgi:hypothetical protein
VNLDALRDGLVFEYARARTPTKSICSALRERQRYDVVDLGNAWRKRGKRRLDHAQQRTDADRAANEDFEVSSFRRLVQPLPLAAGNFSLTRIVLEIKLPQIMEPVSLQEVGMRV